MFTQQLKHLKILDLSFCEFLTETPNFKGVQNVETLIVKGCRRLARLHLSIEHLTKLRFFDFGQCGDFTTYLKTVLLNDLGTSLGLSYLTYPLLLSGHGLTNPDEECSSITVSRNRVVMYRRQETGLVTVLKKILNIFPFASFRSSIVS